MQQGVTRRTVLRLGAGGAAAAYLAACGGSSGGSGERRILFKTWEDHYLPEQLTEIRRKDKIAVKVSFIDDNLTNLQQLKRGGRFDVVSADALWVPKFREEGLIDTLDPSKLSTWKNLYPEARHELLNETNRDEVTADVVAWLDRHA